MIAITRRFLRNRRFFSTSADRPRGRFRARDGERQRQESAPAGGVAVVDGLGGSPATQVVRALGADSARIVSPVNMTEDFGCVAVLLPLHADDLAFETHEALSVLSSIANDQDLAAEFAPGLVIVWCVTSADRRRLAAPRVTHGTSVVGAGNSAALLLGTSWRRERILHAGDEQAAVRCRSAAIRGMVDATSHRSLAGVLLSDTSANITTLDPECLHTLVIRLPDDRWSGAEAVTAAVRERLRTAGRNSGGQA
jgi:hypothetical protein